jgi:hypothetical protein
MIKLLFKFVVMPVHALIVNAWYEAVDEIVIDKDLSSWKSHNPLIRTDWDRRRAVCGYRGPVNHTNLTNRTAP